MQFPLGRMLNGETSLKKQILVPAIAAMVVGTILYSAVLVLGVVSQNNARIQEYREELVSRKKEELKNYTDILFKSIGGRPGAQVAAITKQARYGDSGYFWINDIGRPIPKMVMHPMIPALDGKVLDDPKFNCALGKKQNLFQAFVETVMANGEGYVDYLWPKPLKSGLTQDMPKLSYVRLYKPLNWVIGTGMYIDDIDGLVAKEKERSRQEVTFLIVKVVAIAVGLIIIAYSLLLAFFLEKHLGKPINQLTYTIQNANNDLTVRVPVTTNNEIGQLTAWYNTQTENLHGVIKQLSESAARINSYSGEVSAAVEQQAAVSSEQSAAVAEITSTMEELSASSTQIAEHSKTVVDIATKTWEDTKKGASAVEAVIAKMNEIHADNENSIHEIVELGRKSKEITKVMELINTIADQTKLIAFNAALEASSAGEAGKRFGVVAVEIRRLADSVMESTGEIETKINEIQDAINRLVIASEKGAKGIQDGMEYSGQTSTLLLDVVEAAQSTKESAKQISLSTQQQKTASNQVVTALREIVSGSSQTSESIQQIASISKRLNELSDGLKGHVEKFKVK